MTRLYIARRSSWILLATASATALSGVAGAQTLDSPSASAEEVGGSDIVVTARKTDERLQDVPLTVTAISGAALEAQGATTLKEALVSVPGLSFIGVEAGQSRYVVHGISSSVASPTTGVYIDDVSVITNNPSGFTGAFDPILFDLQRVEVLKGPQGTLYGGSAMGGAIKYVTALPSLSEFSGSVGLGVGTTRYGAMSANGEVVVNLPIVPDVLAARGGFYYGHAGGYIDNVAGQPVVRNDKSSTASPTYTPLVSPSLSTVSKENYNSRDTYSARFSMLFQPDETFTIRPQILHQNSKLDNQSVFWLNLPGLTTSYRRVDQPYHDVATLLSLEVSKDIGPVTLTSLTGYFKRNVDATQDYSFYVSTLNPSPTYYNTDSTLVNQTHSKTFSQEVRLASNNGPDAALSWTIGGFYSNYREKQDGLVANSVIGTPDGQLFQSYVDTRVRQYAAFGEASLNITDAFTVTAGGRYYDTEFGSLTTNLARPLNPTASVSQVGVREKGFNPKFGLSYKVSKDNLLYASVSKGFRPGGGIPTLFATCQAELAQLGYTTPPTGFKSDRLMSFEAGSKNEFANGRVVANVSVFYSKWDDIQQNIRLATCGANFTTNAGRAHVRGAEFEGKVNVTRELQLGGNATYTKATFAQNVPFTPILKGDDVLDTPKWIASAFASYAAPVSDDWNLKVRADYQYRGPQRRAFGTTYRVRFPVNGSYVGTPTANFVLPQQLQFQKGFSVVNLAASVDNGETTFRLFVDNLTDSRPLIDTRLINGDARSSTLRPRTIGAEIRQKF